MKSLEETLETGRIFEMVEWTHLETIVRRIIVEEGNNVYSLWFAQVSGEYKAGQLEREASRIARFTISPDDDAEYILYRVSDRFVDMMHMIALDVV